MTFALGKLGFSGKSLIVPADQELMTCMPRLKLALEFIGSPVERIESLIQKNATLHADMVPTIFADFTTEALQDNTIVEYGRTR